MTLSARTTPRVAPNNGIRSRPQRCKLGSRPAASACCASASFSSHISWEMGPIGLSKHRQVDQSPLLTMAGDDLMVSTGSRGVCDGNTRRSLVTNHAERTSQPRRKPLAEATSKASKTTVITTYERHLSSNNTHSREQISRLYTQTSLPLHIRDNSQVSALFVSIQMRDLPATA